MRYLTTELAELGLSLGHFIFFGGCLVLLALAVIEAVLQVRDALVRLKTRMLGEAKVRITQERWREAMRERDERSDRGA